MENTYRCILIDPLENEIKYVEIERNGEELQQIYNLLGCDMIESAMKLNDTHEDYYQCDTIYVDEEYHLIERDKHFGFVFVVNPEVSYKFFGKGIIIAGDYDGNWISCYSDLEYIKTKIKLLKQNN
jgi:hypothetical protein